MGEKEDSRVDEEGFPSSSKSSKKETRRFPFFEKPENTSGAKESGQPNFHLAFPAKLFLSQPTNDSTNK